MPVRKHRPVPAHVAPEPARADTVHWHARSGPEGVLIGLGAGAADLPLAEFAQRFGPADREGLQAFVLAQLAAAGGGPQAVEERLLLQMHWDPQPEGIADGGDYVLTCLELSGPDRCMTDGPPDPPPGLSPVPAVYGALVRLDTALDIARHTLERAEITPSACWSVDLRSGQLIVSESWKARLGYGPKDLEPYTHDAWARMSHPDDVAGFESAAMTARLSSGEMVQYLSRSRHRDGSWVSFLSFCRAARWNTAGEATMLMGCDLDMTSVSALQGELARERDRLTTILDALPSGKIVLDDPGRIQFINPEACALIGCVQADAAGRPLLELLQIEEGREELQAAIDDPEGAGPVRLRTWRGKRPAVLQVDLALLPKSAGAGRLLLSFNDISALQDLRQQLEQSIDNARFIATHDLMTGLPDRFLMLRVLGEKLAQAHRDGTSLAVLCIDFDNFRLINDTLGHETAGQLIKSAARRLEQGLPEGAVLARTGEGDFVLLLPGADALAAEARAWEIVRSFARPMRLQRRQCFLTVSIGIGLRLGPDDSAEAILRNADMAMHQSESRGRNTVTLFSREIGAQYERRTAVAQALHRALEEGSFELHLQPKFEVQDGIRLIGAEALLRLTDAELGPISPGEFIPVAEVDGLVAAIDLEVMRLAGALLTGWSARGILLPLAVNLNATTLDEPGHADLAERLSRVGLDPRQVTVELTETGLAAPGERQRRNLERLRDAGYKIAIDDFGTGQSALGMLQSLPVAEIKIDRSFVSGLDGPEPDRARALVRAILAMAGALGLRAIAEGVETEAQFEVLYREGCPAMQGFLLGRPLDLRSFEARYLTTAQRLRVAATAGIEGQIA